MPDTGRTGVRWLRSSREIRDLRRNGIPFRGSFIYARVVPKGSRIRAESGVSVVTGRGFPGAVSRNRARRRVRGCVYDLRELLGEGRSYLFECRPGSEKADYQLLVNDVREILSRAENCEEKRRRTPGGG